MNRILRAGMCAALLSIAAPAAVPTPESHFGHPIGVDKKLLDWDKVVTYFQALQKSSDKIVVKELGKTVDNRPFIAAWISSPANIKNLDKYRDIQAKLADPRKTTPAEAEKLYKDGKTIVLITCSIHATEVASTHTAVEFAYKLLTESNPKYQAILDNTIFILVPSQNPDGVDIVTKWYRRALGSQWEGTSPPELYHKYVGHDNNRDWYIFSQPETQHTVSQLHNVWHPQIVYDVHQQGAYASRMFVPPWMDPVDPNIDGIIAQLCNSVGMQIAADLTLAGKTGVAVNAMYDFWTPARHYQAYHGGLRILTESASANIASPLTVKKEQITGNALGYDARERSWNYLEPWLGGEWRLRDIIDYQEIAFESVLYQAAIRREEFLRAFYKVGQRAVAKAAPYAFVIPRDQFDPGGAEKMLNTLMFGQVEVEIADEDFQAGGKSYPKGSYVIRMHQPYSSWAKTLLERQVYPDLRLYPGGPPKRPYDVTAQTLPLLMGADVVTVADNFTAKLRTVNNVILPRTGGKVLKAGDVESWRSIFAAFQNSPMVFRDPANGDFYFDVPQGLALKGIQKPRVGLYTSAVPNMDEGWTRWMFDQFKVPYGPTDKTEINAGELSNIDVIVFPDMSPNTISDGYTEGSMPTQYVGGIAPLGVERLKKLVENGMTVVFMNHSTDWAIEHLGLKVKNVIKGLSNREFYSPGSILNCVLDTKHPIAFGMKENIFIWSEGSPAWDVPEGAGKVVAHYPQSGVLASGWLLGEKYLAGKASIVDVPMGKGHVILFGMRPQYRAQSYETLKMLFNSMMLR